MEVSEPLRPWNAKSSKVAGMGVAKPPIPPSSSAARRRPTASISSMKTMHCPPHFLASLFAFHAR